MDVVVVVISMPSYLTQGFICIMLITHQDTNAQVYFNIQKHPGYKK